MDQLNEELKEIHLTDYLYLFTVVATCIVTIAYRYGFNKRKNNYKKNIEKYAEYADSYSKAYDLNSKSDPEKIEITTLYDTSEKENEPQKKDKESPDEQTKTSNNVSENQKNDDESPENKTESPGNVSETQKFDNKTPKNEIKSQENKKVSDEIKNISQRKKFKKYAKEDKRVNKLIEKLDFKLDICEIELNGIIYKTHKNDIDEFMKDISYNNNKTNEIDLINARAKCFQQTIEKYNNMVNDCIKETKKKYNITDSNFWRISRLDEIESIIAEVKEEQEALHLENYSNSLNKVLEEQKKVERELENLHSTNTTDDFKIIYYDSNNNSKDYENFEQPTKIEHFENTLNSLQETNKNLKETMNLEIREFKNSVDRLNIEFKRIRSSCYDVSIIEQYYLSVEKYILIAKKL